MPFDSAPLPETLPDTLTPEVRRKRLIEALRSPMPEGFEWFFPATSTCALGLAHRVGLTPKFEVACIQEISALWRRTSHEFGLEDAADVFGAHAYSSYSVTRGGDVTPRMVADRLESLPYVSP